MIKFKKEVFGYFGSVTIILLLIGVLVFLSFNEIPPENNDVVKMIIGALVVSLGSAVSTMIGRNPDEVNDLKRSNAKHEEENIQLRERVTQLEKQLRELQAKIITNFAKLVDAKESDAGNDANN